MLRRVTTIGVLVVLVVSLSFASYGSSQPYDSIEDISHPYAFSVVRWETEWLLQMGPSLGDQTDVRGLPDGGVGLVLDYFSDNASQGDTSPAGQSSTSSALHHVQAVMSSQVTHVLRAQGIYITVPPFVRAVFPPVNFELSDMPRLLIISPRERIGLYRTVVLSPYLTMTEIEKIEASVEKLGFSALIEGLGGLSLYPSIVPADYTLEATLEIIVHEWFHQYLFFTPLGKAYYSNYDMTTVNETVAEVAGRELGSLVYDTYYDGMAAGASFSAIAQGTSSENSFSFNDEMRTTRITVDTLLAQGRVDEAETYMRERRDYFSQHGYNIRKLNQAYFAFHGTYAASDPGTTSPIGQQVDYVRKSSSSLADFVQKVSRLSSVEALSRLVPARE